jgi:hypothetical protein
MGDVIALSQSQPEDYVGAINQIKKLWNEGEVEFRPYCEKRMKMRRLLPSDVRDIVRGGRIVGHSKPGDYWRYEIVGRLLDGGKAKCVVEIANQLLIINIYRVLQ